MKTICAYEDYLNLIKKDILKVMAKRLLFLEIKLKLIESTDDEFYDKFLRVISKQKALVKQLKRRKQHINNYALKNLDYVDCSLKTKNRVRQKLKIAMKVYTWLYSESKFLNLQVVALKSLKRNNKRGSFGKFVLKYRKFMKSDLNSQLLKEEQELFLSMKVYEKRRFHLFEYSNDILKLEKINSYEFVFLRVAIFFNALPFHGVGDLLSLPFWFLDGFFRIYEHSFKEYQDWKMIKKMDLKQMNDELDRIKSTF